MKQQKRLMAMMMSFVILFSMIPFGVSAAAIGNWQFSGFGSSTSVTNNTYTIDDNDGSVTILAKNGKLASNEEAISFYFKQLNLPTDGNFEIHANAKVVSFNSNSTPNSPNQKSFGLMLRSDFVGDTTKQSSNYVALGGFGPGSAYGMQAFYKIGITGTAFDTNNKYIASPVFSDVNVPLANEEYDMKIKKSGDAFELTVNGKTQKLLLDNLFGNKIYAGLYVARDAEIKFSNFDITVDQRKPKSLVIDATSMKKTYLKDAALDTTGLQVKAVYEDDSEEVLSPNDYVLTGFNSSNLGTNPITISFNGEIQTLDLTIVPLTATELGIKYLPAKREYNLGDQFNPEGLEVTAAYNSGTIKDLVGEDISKYVISIPEATVTGTTYTFVTPGVKTVEVRSVETPSTVTSFNVTVKDALLTGLEIAQPPQQTLYYLGDSFKSNGMIVYALYSDNSKVRILSNEFTTTLNTAAAGPNQVAISYRGHVANTPVTVKQKEVLRIEVNQYPQTTYLLGEDIDTSGLTVSKRYDNLDVEVFDSTNYTIDSSTYNKDIAGVYDINIMPTDSSIQPISYKVTVREPVTYTWSPIRFGQSTSTTNNTITPKQDGSVQIVALEGGGKVTGDHDGISFYYIELDAAKDNFVLSAEINVSSYAKTPAYDGQESFGIMARDAIGSAGDSSVFASNIAAIGGYSGGTTKAIGTQLFVRSGVETKDGGGSKGIQSEMLRNERPSPNNTPYKLTLTKTNSGFTGQINEEPMKSIYAPDIMNVQDNKMYVGFYAARLATIDVSNIQLTVTAAETDAPKMEAERVDVVPSFEFVSLDKTSNTDYSISVKSNVNGTVTLAKDLQVIAAETMMEAGKILTIPTTVTQQTYTNFSAVFIPDDTQFLSSNAPKVTNFTVTMKTFVPGGDIYVSTEGTSTGTGTLQSPLDLDTAIAYVSAGQKIILQEGAYVRNAKIEIKKGNDGNSSARKYLVAAPGARPIIDFDKKSEGVVLSGSYWHVKGIDFTRTAGNTKGFTVGGSNNIVEDSRFYANGDTGLQISRTDDAEDMALWPSNNLILNCESYDNADPSNNNADGFAAKLTSGTGNIFRGDIAHNNIDDGWDLYTKAGTGAIGPVIIEDSIAYNNGTLTNGSVGAGDKNGFKLGGEGIHVPHIIRNSIAFGNGAYGFASNSNPGVRAESTNIAFNNAKGNMNFTSYTGIPLDFRIDGFISYHTSNAPKDNYPAALNAATNYMWNGTKSVNGSGAELTNANFASLDPIVPYQRDQAGNIVKGSFLKFIPTAVSSGGASFVPAVTIKTVIDGVQITGDPVNETVNGKAVATVRISDKDLAKALGMLKEQNTDKQTLVIDVNSTESAAQVVLPAGALEEGNEVTFSMRSNGVTYDLPLGALKLEDLAKSLGASMADMNVRITIAQATEESEEKLRTSLQERGMSLVGNPIEFTVVVESNGKQVAVNDFGSTYVTRSFTVDGALNPQQATAVWMDPLTGHAAFVPAMFTVSNGQTLVTMKRPGNSLYAVVQSSQTFDDLNRHWAKSDVELLASKGVVQGVAAHTFAPNALITRAEFATLLVRALGLNEEASTRFTDVPANSWFTGAAGASAKAGLIEGFEDGSFRPNELITREQMAVMITRAMKFAGKSAAVDLKQLDKFADSRGLSAWSREAVAGAVSAGIVNGVTDTTFVPAASATRAEAAVMLKRFLEFVAFMN